jgi:hypothetical protein
MSSLATREDLMRILTRYEGAVHEVEREGDESQLSELQEAREDLMKLLQQARVFVEAQ